MLLLRVSFFFMGSELMASIPSIALTSFTESLRPSSLIVTCALLEKAMQRRSMNSWRAELETAVRTGCSSSSMTASI